VTIVIVYSHTYTHTEMDAIHCLGYHRITVHCACAALHDRRQSDAHRVPDGQSRLLVVVPRLRAQVQRQAPLRSLSALHLHPVPHLFDTGGV